MSNVHIISSSIAFCIMSMQNNRIGEEKKLSETYNALLRKQRKHYGGRLKTLLFKIKGSEKEKRNLWQN